MLTSLISSIIKYNEPV